MQTFCQFYRGSLRFVSRKLKPKVNMKQQEVAELHGPDNWQEKFKLTLALCDGAPARLQALFSIFRSYSAAVMQILSPTDFWREGMLPIEGVAVDWRAGEADWVPPIPRGSVKAECLGDGEDIAMLVEEMVKHRDNFLSAVTEFSHELSRFWLRKTGKPVLAVLLVRDRYGSRRFFRGQNLEVSMPTGSLCSERNVIGSALASDPSLCRQHMCGIAVLSVPLNLNLRLSERVDDLADEFVRLDPGEENNPLGPCGSCLVSGSIKLTCNILVFVLAESDDLSGVWCRNG